MSRTAVLALLTLLGFWGVAAAAPAPDSSELDRALQRARSGELAAVEEPLTALVKKDDPATPRILEALAEGYLLAFRYRAASGCVEQLLKRQPDNPRALLLRARAAEGADANWGPARLTVEAEADYQRVLELEPDNHEARKRLADGLLQAEKGTDALAHYQELRQRQPKNLEAVLGMARCQYRLGQLEEAQKLVDAVLAQQPKHAAALAERGNLALQAGEPAEAEAWLRKALEVGPSDRVAVYALAMCLRQAGKDEESKQALKKLEALEADSKRLDKLAGQMDNTPHDPALHHEIGVLFLRVGQEKDGLRWLKSALLEDPDHRPTHRTLADHFDKAGNKELAEKHRRLAGQD